MKKYGATIPAILAVLFFCSCGVFSHGKLRERYRDASDRYEKVKESTELPGASERLDNVKVMLRDTSRALKRWDNEKARTLLDMTEEELDLLENPPKLDKRLRDLYEPTGEAFTEEAE